ncbi:hypothetical protein LCGC14_1283620 [marine sediment metagenome]|uniref:Uncharacterized protein n=1 Tax=marine sediment metagenome TaxID=412755 RepID=A0A0F9NXL1_9ZZZZ
MDEVGGDVGLLRRDLGRVDEKLDAGGSDFADAVVYFEVGVGGELIDLEIVQGCQEVAECDLANAVDVRVWVCVVGAHEFTASA